MTLIHVPDSFSLLRDLDADSFDVTITDPPYDAHCQANQTSGTAMKRMVNGETKRGGIPRVIPKFDPLDSYAFVGDLLRVTRRWVIVFCTVEAFGHLQSLYGKQYVRGCVWYKPNSMGQLTGDRPASCYEGIAVLHRDGKKRWNGRGSYGLWTCNGTRGEPNRHPNQKPLALCQKLVALFSDRDEMVFDPFCGRGRIGEAATSLGRRYLGLDIDAEHIAWAECRLAATQPVTDQYALGLCMNRGERIDG